VRENEHSDPEVDYCTLGWVSTPTTSVEDRRMTHAMVGNTDQLISRTIGPKHRTGSLPFVAFFNRPYPLDKAFPKQ
jgi:hypothetical protein